MTQQNEKEKNMSTIKIVSLILLAVYLIFSGLADLMGFHLHWIAAFILGLTAVVSGALILISINEYCHCSDEPGHE